MGNYWLMRGKYERLDRMHDAQLRANRDEDNRIVFNCKAPTREEVSAFIDEVIADLIKQQEEELERWD